MRMQESTPTAIAHQAAADMESHCCKRCLIRGIKLCPSARFQELNSDSGRLHFPPLTTTPCLTKPHAVCLVLTHLFLWFPALPHCLPVRQQFPSTPHSAASSTPPEVWGKGTPPPKAVFHTLEFNAAKESACCRHKLLPLLTPHSSP